MTPLNPHVSPLRGSRLLPAETTRTRKALVASALLALGGLPGLLHAGAINTATLLEDAAATSITLTAAGTNYTVLTQPAKGSLAGLPGGAFTGTASGTYTPSANLNGSDSFTFRTIDAGVTNTFTFNITINPVNDAPVAVIPVVTTLAGRDWFVRTNSAPVANALVWNALASSADGSLLVAAVDGGSLYTSTDAGLNWVARDSSRNWEAVASSSSGANLVAVADGGRIYTSTDSGANWTPRESARNWKSVASSADGQRLLAADFGGRLYTSSDAGVTWTARESARQWYAVASSSTATNLVAAAYGGAIYTSSDFGTNWVSRTSGSKLWSSVASSSNGQKLVAAEVNGFINTSSDAGATWTAQTNSGSRFWTSVASSGDGSELIASAYGGKLYTSADSGVTWTAQADSRLWVAVAASLDGGRLAAVVESGFVYTSSDVIAPATITVAEESGSYTNANFFSTLNAGPNDPDSITAITVSTTNTNLFSVLPSISTNGILTFTPATNQFGSATITVDSVSDGSLSSVPTPNNTVLVKITNVADVPTQTNVTITIAEDTVFTFSATSFASGYGVDHLDGAEKLPALSYAFETLPSVGTLKLSGAPLIANQSVSVASFTNLTYEPALNQSGTTSFRVTASDGSRSTPGGTNAATITFIISGANDAPFAVPQAVSTLEDTALPITLNGTDADGNALNYTIVTGPTKGSLSGTPPSVTYTPTSNLSGTDSFTFLVNDGTVNSSVSTVSITVVAVNDPPTLANVFVAGTEDTTFVFSKSVFDATGIYLDPVETNAFASLTIVSLPLTGTLTVGGSAATAGQVIAADALGTFAYVPALNEYGAKNFVVRATDSGGASSAPATVTVVLAPTSDQPSLAAVKIEFNEDTTNSLSSASFSAKFSDPDGGSLTSIKIISLPTAGTLKHGATNAAAGLVLTTSQIPDLSYYRPANDNGDATFTVTASNGAASSGEAVVTLSVVPVNDAPTATIPTLTLVPVATDLTSRLAGPLNFKSVVSSPDFSKLAAVADNDRIYTSIDGGTNWTARDSIRNWSSIAASTNWTAWGDTTNNMAPQVLAASVFRGKLYVSLDGGTNWTERGSDSQWRSVAVSAQVATNALSSNPVATIAAVVNGGQIWVSQDTGTNWTRRAVSDGSSTNLLWTSVALSANGSRIVASVYGGNIYTSADRGTNWTAVATPRLWNNVVASLDGSRILATEFGGSIWQSTDSGATWAAFTSAPTNANWASVTMSADGSRILAAVTGGKIYRSLNSGVSWSAVRDEQNWSTVAGSQDLKKAVVAVAGGSLSTSTDYDIPTTITVDEDSGAYSQVAFATAPSAGPSNESSQTISYTITGASTNLFSVAPAISADGTLTFTPKANANGSELLTVTVKDNGGTTNILGTVTGVDSKNIGTFTVTVSSVDDGPSATAQAVGVIEDSGANTITLAGTDPESDAITNYVVVTFPTQGSLNSLSIGALTSSNRNLGSNPVLTYTPTNNATGLDSFTFQVVSKGITSAAATVSITITNVNDVPVATAQAVTTLEDTAKAITLAGTDIEGSALTYTVVSQPTNGVLSGTAPALTYTPSNNYFGADSFTFRVNDGTANSATNTVSITVQSVNDIPTANSLTGTNTVAAIEDSATNFVFSLSGTSPEAGKTLTYQILTLPTKGSLIQGSTILGRLSDLGTNTVLSFKPGADNFGADSFTFKVNDGTDNSAFATVQINITNVNDIPSFTIPMTLKPGGDKAAWDLLATSLGSWNALAVSTNGSIVAAASATDLVISTNSGVTRTVVAGAPGSGGYNAVAASADGSKLLVARGTGLYTYSAGTWFTPSALTSGLPALNWVSVASSHDATKLSAAASGDKVYVSRNSGTNWTALGAARDWEAVTSSADGTKLAAAEYNGLIYTYTTADNGTNWTVTARGTVNRFWTSIASSADGSKLAATVVNGQIYTSDDGGATWTARDSNRAWSSIAMSADGKVLVAGTLGGKLYYSDDSGVSWSSKDSDRVWGAVGISGDGGNAIAAVIDGSLYRAAGYFTEQTLAVDEDTATTIAGFAYDISAGAKESSDQTVTFVVSNNNTNLFKAGPAISADGTLTFTPADNQSGSATVTVFVQDNGGTALGGVDKSASKPFNIQVKSVNDAPVAGAQTVTTAEDTAKAITLVGTDAENSALTYTVVRQPTLGTLSGTAPNLTYTPDANKSGADNFTFKVSDGTSESATATVTIVVAAANDLPVVSNQSVTTIEDEPVAILLTGSDADGDALTYTVVAGPTKGELTGTAPNLVYVPNSDVSGSDSFTYMVNDGTADSGLATVTITVTAVNDPPVAGAFAVTTDEDTTAIITLQGFDSEGATLTYTVVRQPVNGSLSGEGANLEYLPNGDFNGSDSFTYKVSDGSLESGTVTVVITVKSVADAPVALTQTLKVVQGNSAAVTLAGYDGDKDALTYTVASQPKQGTLTGTAPNLVYTANADATGTDSFTFRVNDGTSDSGLATVLIVIGETSKLSIKSSDGTTLTLEVRAPKGAVVQIENGTKLGTWSATAIKVTGEGTDVGVPVNLQVDKNVPVRFWRLNVLSAP
jgi:large repetitive protein